MSYRIVQQPVYARAKATLLPSVATSQTRKTILEAFARFRESHGMRSLTMADVAEIAKGRA